MIFLTTSKRYYVVGDHTFPREGLCHLFYAFAQRLSMVFVCHEKQSPGGVLGKQIISA